MHLHHDHGEQQLSDGRIVLAIALNLVLTVVELVGGIISGSLALVADALHNFNDCGSLLIALVARRVARRQADHQRTFGYRRAEVIGALINLTVLIVVALYLIYEAVSRYFNQQPIEGLTVVWVASIALVVDVATAWLLIAMARGSMNVRAAFLHNVSDALASVGVIVAGVCAWLWEFYEADLIMTVVISAYILWQSWALMRTSISILMESAPEDIPLQSVADAMLAVPHVVDVHHLHLWRLCEEENALEAHVVIDLADLDLMESIKFELKRRLSGQFLIHHSTLEFEIDGHEHHLATERKLVPEH